MEVETQPVAPTARLRTNPTKCLSVFMATLRAVLSVRGVMTMGLVRLLFFFRSRWRLLLEPPPTFGGFAGQGGLLFERDPDAGDRRLLGLGGGR
jgi:hypothetical protein